MLLAIDERTDYRPLSSRNEAVKRKFSKIGKLSFSLFGKPRKKLDVREGLLPTFSD